MVQDEVDDGRIGPFGESSRVSTDGSANDSEDAGADNRADAERGKRDGSECLLESVLRLLRFIDQLVDRFGCKDLPAQRACSSNKELFREVLLRNYRLLTGKAQLIFLRDEGLPKKSLSLWEDSLGG